MGHRVPKKFVSPFTYKCCSFTLIFNHSRTFTLIHARHNCYVSLFLTNQIFHVFLCDNFVSNETNW
ncbi:hypothetical protein LINGRAHAP2_LOCUS17641 [Linum grandiflorum]